MIVAAVEIVEIEMVELEIVEMMGVADMLESVDIANMVKIVRTAVLEILNDKNK